MKFTSTYTGITTTKRSSKIVLFFTGLRVFGLLCNFPDSLQIISCNVITTCYGQSPFEKHGKN